MIESLRFSARKFLRALLRSKARSDLASVRVDKGAHLVEVNGSRFLYVAYRVKRSLEPLEIVKPQEFLRRVRRFLNTLCEESCEAYLLSRVAKAPDNYLRKLELMITNKVVEYEHDRANARIRRELKILKTVHDKLISGYIPIDLSSVIVVACRVDEVPDIYGFSRAIKERIELASKVVGLEVEPVDLPYVHYVTNFR